MDRVTFTTRSTWKTASPARTPKPICGETTRRPRVSTVMSAIRATVFMATGRRVRPSGRRAARDTELPTMRKFRVPMARPTAAPSPTSTCPKDTAATRAATPRTSAPETVRRATSGTSGRERWVSTATGPRPACSEIAPDGDDGLPDGGGQAQEDAQQDEDGARAQPVVEQVPEPPADHEGRRHAQPEREEGDGRPEVGALGRHRLARHRLGRHRLARLRTAPGA